jgi:hypothetical protein
MGFIATCARGGVCVCDEMSTDYRLAPSNYFGGESLLGKILDNAEYIVWSPK